MNKNSLHNLGNIEKELRKELHIKTYDRHFYRFSVVEMKRIYRGFKTECPTGLITEEVFHGIYSRFFPHGGKMTELDDMKNSSHNNSPFSFRIIYSILV